MTKMIVRCYTIIITFIVVGVVGVGVGGVGVGVGDGVLVDDVVVVIL